MNCNSVASPLRLDPVGSDDSFMKSTAASACYESFFYGDREKVDGESYWFNETFLACREMEIRRQLEICKFANLQICKQWKFQLTAEASS